MNIDIFGPIAQLRNGLPYSDVDVAVKREVSNTIYVSINFSSGTIWDEIIDEDTDVRQF